MKTTSSHLVRLLATTAFVLGVSATAHAQDKTTQLHNRATAAMCANCHGTDGRTITAFREKPEQESGYINGGFMVLDKRVAAYLDDSDTCVFERGPLEWLTREGQLKAYCHDGFWQCMDTYREQQMLDQMWRSGNAPWKA